MLWHGWAEALGSAPDCDTATSLAGGTADLAREVAHGPSSGQLLRSGRCCTGARVGGKRFLTSESNRGNDSRTGRENDRNPQPQMLPLTRRGQLTETTRVNDEERLIIARCCNYLRRRNHPMFIFIEFWFIWVFDFLFFLVFLGSPHRVKFRQEPCRNLARKPGQGFGRPPSPPL